MRLRRSIAGVRRCLLDVRLQRNELSAELRLGVIRKRDLRLTDLVYDAAGNLTRQTRAGGLVTTIEVDAVGRRTAPRE